MENETSGRKMKNFRAVVKTRGQASGFENDVLVVIGGHVRREVDSWGF